MKRFLPIALYVFALLALAGAASQLIEHKVSAAGRCCTVSSDCPGEQLCYAPTGGLQACCDERAQVCPGESYCRDRPPGDGGGHGGFLD